MTLRFTLLASGSRGNAALVETPRAGLLVDAGLKMKLLERRLTKARLTEERIGGLLLTHTHSDHWDDTVLTELHRRGLPLFCHREHSQVLRRYSEAYPLLEKADLVREVREHEVFEPVEGLSCLPIPVCHDSGAAFGYRLEGESNLFGEAEAIGYASDLGCWDDFLAERFANVDLLAIEHNHDVGMQRNSNRPLRLVRRVLGNEGHLSNHQAAALLMAVLQKSEPGRLKHVVQLHLSRDCNKPALALEADQAVLDRLGVEPRIHAGRQDRPLPTIPLRAAPRRAPRPTSPRRSAPAPDPFLPGLE